MNNRKFITALLAVIIFEILMVLIRPVGLSLLKFAITLLVWVSFFLSLSVFIRNYNKLKTDVPKNSFGVFIILLGWNIVNIMRSLFSNDGSLTTLFGNSNTSLALLVPFSLAFCYAKENLKVFNNLIISLIIIGIPAFLIFFAVSNDRFDLNYNIAFELLIIGAVFLINVIPCQISRNKFLIVLGSILLFYLGIVTGYRVMLLRILLLYLILIPIYLYIRYKRNWIPTLVLVSLFIPFFLIKNSIETQQSPFEKFLSRFERMEMSVDTRTFLYLEVYDDLKKSDKLFVGKGSNGTYYSPYFDDTGEDTSNRLSVEVGILAILLKGGFVAVFLYLTILFMAIYYALFRSKNHFVMSLGFMLVIHTLLLFISNYLDYSVYNVAIWFFIGVCFSDEIRSLDNSGINNILNNADQIF